MHLNVRKVVTAAVLAGTWLIGPSGLAGTGTAANAYVPATASAARTSSGPARLAAGFSIGHGPNFATSQRPSERLKAIPNAIDTPYINYYSCPPCVCWINTNTGATGPVYCCPNSAGTPCSYTHILTYGTAQDLKYSYAGGLNSASIQKLNLKAAVVATYTGIPGEPLNDFAVGAKGIVAASFACAGSICGDNTLTFWAGYSSTPTATLVDGNMSSMSAVAIDSQSDVFVSGQSAGTGALEVDEVSPAGAIKQLNISGSVAGGIALDEKNHLWVGDQGNGLTGTMTEYSPVGGYAKPIASFAVSGDDTRIAVDAQGSRMIAANNVGDGSEFASQMVAYQLPKGNVIATSATTYGAESFGVAFLPKSFPQ